MNAYRGTLESVKTCREIAQDVLGKDWESELKSTKSDEGTLWALGYCHIDTAWCVDVCRHLETADNRAGYGHGVRRNRKWRDRGPHRSVYSPVYSGADLLSGKLDLMDRYPEYRFMATSAQHFKWLEQLYPKVFERLQEKIKQGSFGGWAHS
jgi:alpha-mannosidase